ncbi:MAG: hypothetical protein KBE04_13375 [Phycisphaerae bacterium]|nr:hypothetical protein [Phycisphaerae bacterium]
MAKKDPLRSRTRLGFREIVPGQDQGAADAQTAGSEIPRFDLGREIMANHRKAVGATRKGPGQTSEPPPGPAVPQPVQEGPGDAGSIWCPAMTEAQRRVIAQIVGADIERLCRGERVFGT